jgi:glutamate/tyrosine decarboxylase-like PLP-dependent enzyme
VDGAFGALAAVSPSLKPIVAGMERADSVAFDLHKWMYMPYETGCVLVRDAAAHRGAFSMTPPYLSRMPGGIASEADRFSEYGPQLSRGFRALKVWMSLKEHGVDRYARLIEQNVAQARHLALLVEASDDLELMAPVPLNVVCYRFNPGGMDGADLDGVALDAINREILVRLQEEGTAVPSHTILGGRFAIRAAITNHRSRREDFDLLVKETVRLGRSILGKKAPA